MSTIDNKTLTNGIFLDTPGSYASPLTITSTGAIKAYGGTAVFASGSLAGTVINFGTIRAVFGIALHGGGYVANTGYILGAIAGVSIDGLGTVVNSGSITGFPSISLGSGVVTNNKGAFTNGISIGNNGTITNAGLVSSEFGVRGGANTRVVNSGTIIGLENDGVHIDGPATIVNSGTLVGIVGVQVAGPATIVNSGTIGIYQGFGANAIYLKGTSGGTVSDLVVLEHGSTLTPHGTGAAIQGSGAVNVTVELAGYSGSAVTVGYTNLVRGFTAVDLKFGPGGNATLAVGNKTGTLAGTISGFTLPSDVLDLTAIGADGRITGQSAMQVTVAGSLGTVAFNLDASDATNLTTFSDGAGGTDLAVACFCRGTTILTEAGEVPVEDLKVGDRLVTLSGARKPILWIGIGRDLVTRANKLARPVIVRQGALADGVPTRDLYLTHGHALYLDAVLIPVENLINHRSILWDTSARVVEYYHIELDDHDVLLAEGTPAESYYDAGNRAQFHNTRPGSLAGEARPTFAPVLDSGEIVERLWARLFDRAGGRFEIAATENSDLHLLVDGARLEPAAVADGVFAFVLQAAPTRTLLLRSRSVVPSLLGLSRRDHWPLGVAITGIVVQHAGIETSFDYDQPQLREGGCYPPEDGFCCTDGEFALPPRFFLGLSGPLTLRVHTDRRFRLRYPIAPSLPNVA